MLKRMSGALLAAILLTSAGVTAVPAEAAITDATRYRATSITSQPASATISRYGTVTRTTFSIKAAGTNLRYAWEAKVPGGTWRKITGATKSSYTAKATSWKSGTWFRVKVTSSYGATTSKEVKLTVLQPSATPAQDAETKFGLSGLTQGPDLSAYQYTPGGRISIAKVADWAGPDGFTILRMGSGARPIKQKVDDLCTGKTFVTGTTPGTRDCAYPVLGQRVRDQQLALGHYWFNGWTDRMDPTKANLFAAGYTAKKHAEEFVTDLLADGLYTSADPLVLDIEPGRAWTRTYQGAKYKATLKAWTSAEATTFLNEVKRLLAEKGYQANLYVYMSSNRAKQGCSTSCYWRDVAGLARLWVASWGTDNGRIPDKLPQTGAWDDWAIWQYTSNLRIDGDGVGALDGNVAKPGAWTQLPPG